VSRRCVNCGHAGRDHYIALNGCSKRRWVMTVAGRAWEGCPCPHFWHPDLAFSLRASWWRPGYNMAGVPPGWGSLMPLVPCACGHPAWRWATYLSPGLFVCDACGGVMPEEIHFSLGGQPDENDAVTRTVIAERKDGFQVLVTLWVSGEIEVALRQDNGSVWGPPLVLADDRGYPVLDPVEVERDRETFVDQLLREARG
jgi:hypothetical protein